MEANARAKSLPDEAGSAQSGMNLPSDALIFFRRMCAFVPCNVMIMLKDRDCTPGEIAGKSRETLGCFNNALSNERNVAAPVT
jgi:hypothetical protein